MEQQQNPFKLLRQALEQEVVQGNGSLLSLAMRELDKIQDHLLNVAIENNKPNKIHVLLKHYGAALTPESKKAFATASKETRIKLINSIAEIDFNMGGQSSNIKQLLYIIAIIGDAEAAKNLLGQSRKNSEESYINTPTNGGNTMLETASANGHLELVKLLVEKGANINSQTNEGYTPIYRAAIYDHLDVVEYLKQNGADIQIKPAGNYTQSVEEMLARLQQKAKELTDCAICMEKVQKAQIVKLQCKHELCMNCLQNWHNNNNNATCPFCRTNL